jgi:acetoin:2,6-dichlorophenolindophenol oxidoreductase subunit alpha
VIVDGQDVIAMEAAVSEAIARARAGHGPSLLEMKTYRLRPFLDRPARYRPDGEPERLEQSDLDPRREKRVEAA